MIIVTAAFPFVPAELNIAHFSSTYVPADVFCRLLNVFSNSAVLVSATDYHSIFASHDGMNTDIEMCNLYHQAYINMFEKMNIKFDHYIKTSDEEHTQNVYSVYNKLATIGLIDQNETLDYVCNRCGCHLPKRLFQTDEGDKKCSFCSSGSIVTQMVSHKFLNLRKAYERGLVDDVYMPQPDVYNMNKQYLAHKLDSWDISRNNNLGISIPNALNQSFYIWFDSLIAYDSLASHFSQGNQKIVHFIGKNIVYYHSVVLPVISKNGFSNKSMHQISARGFLNFDETDKAMISVDLLTSKYSADFVRFFLCFKVKDSMSDYSFREDDFQRVVSFYCCKKLGAFYYKLWDFLKQNDALPLDFQITAEQSEQEEIFLHTVSTYLETASTQFVLKQIIKYVSELHNLLNKKDRNNTAFIVREASVVLSILSAYMPQICKQYSIFEDWCPKTIDDALDLSNRKLKKNKEIIKLFT